MSERERGKKVTVAEQFTAQVNRYYAKVSRKFLVAGVIVFLILLMYILCVTMFFGEYVTYDNLKYLVRDFDKINLSGSVEFDKIVYNAGDNTSFGFFKNGLSMCATDGYSYYDASGGLLTEEKLGYAAPAMETSDKYVLIYDLGGKKYTVLNQLTKIIDRETDGEIIAGDISSDGSIVLAVRSNETRYVVKLYNGAFSEVMSIYKENYVLGVALSPNGKTVAICSAVPSDSDFDCEIELCRRGESEPVARLKYSHAMPLDVYPADDGFVVLCSTQLLFIGYGGETVATVPFTGMSLKYADVNGTTAVVVGSTNALGSENRIIVLDTGESFGDIIFDFTLKERVRGVYATRDTENAYAYLKLTDCAAVLRPDGMIENGDKTGAEILSVVPMKGGALVCGRASATLEFNK